MEAQANQERRQRKRPRFRVRRGSRESPSVCAVAVVENEQLYASLTNDTLWSRQFSKQSDQSTSDAVGGPWRYVGSAVSVLDMSADERFLYAVDHSGVTWQVDRGQNPTAETDAKSATSVGEAAKWVSWDAPAAGAAGAVGAVGKRPPNRCIALCGGFMYAINDEHRLLRTALDEVSADSVATARPAPATDRQWSTIPAWEEFAQADGDKLPIGITGTRDALLVACADGKMCRLSQPLDNGSASETVPSTLALTWPLLPKVLWSRWTSVACVEAAHCVRLFAAAVLTGGKARSAQKQGRPVVNYLCSDGDDAWSHPSGDISDTLATNDSDDVTTLKLTWRSEELSMRLEDPALAVRQAEATQDNRAPAKKKQRTSAAGADEGQNALIDGFRAEGHEWIGKHVKRMVIRQVDAAPTIADAVIFKWWPEGDTKDDPALWKIK